MRLRLISLAFLAAFASACGATSTPAARSAGPLVLPLASVQRQVAGKPVVYLFTAPSCESCAEEARALAADTRGPKSLQLVGVDLTNDSPTAFAAYIASIGLANSQFIWTIDQDGGLARRYGIVSLSSSVFVASDGQIRFVNSGPQDAQTLAAQLGQLTSGATPFRWRGEPRTV